MGSPWRSFLRLRRFRYYHDPSFSKEIETPGKSVEVLLYGVERKDVDGKTKNPEHYVPTAIAPPLLLDAEEEALLREASIQVLWE